MSVATAEEAALDRLLDADPFALSAFLKKGDLRAAAGDVEAARLLYLKGLRLAETRRLSPDEAVAVDAARTRLQALLDRADAGRQARLRQRALPPERWSPRFREAIEVAAGRRRHYPQVPTAFAYPGLPTRQFFEPGEFAWAAGIEAAAPAIKAELLQLLAGGEEAFRAYIQADVGSGPLGDNRALLNARDWSVLTLCENGWLSPNEVRRCPRTWEAVLAAPVPRIAGWGPTVLFSLLKAGARIAPHTGMFNTRLICHLPLIVPPGCGFRVGNEVRAWEEGRLLIFDDTIEHEAWNDSGEDRVVLIFDVWRPELNERERHELTALFSD